MFRDRKDKDEADLFFKTFSSSKSFDTFINIFEKMASDELKVLHNLAVASLNSNDVKNAALQSMGKHKFLQDFLNYIGSIKGSVKNE